MKNLFITLFLILPTWYAPAQNIESISIGKKETIYSKVLNENRKIWVYTPGNTPALVRGTRNKETVVTVCLLFLEEQPSLQKI